MQMSSSISHVRKLCVVFSKKKNRTVVLRLPSEDKFLELDGLY
jgi:hypothetical protein